MILLRYNRTLIETNCYILADSQQRIVLVVDPGAGSAEWIEETLTSRRLSLGDVLYTHGHINHMWDSRLVTDEVLVHVPDLGLYGMEDPAAMGPTAAGVFPEASGHSWIKPKGTAALPREFFEGEGGQIVPGVAVHAVPTPGHMEDSCVFLLSGKIDPDHESMVFLGGVFGRKLMLNGDVLFKDNIGRTGLPGSDPVAAIESLRTLTGVIDPATVFFPGHGPPSTVGWEKEHSHYLKLAVSDKMT